MSYSNLPPVPPSQPSEYSIQPPRTSGSAIASLVLGVLGCIPFITGLLAVIFGIAGLAATRGRRMGGRGLAIAGLILGLLSLCGWGGGSAMLGWGYVRSAPARGFARQFVADLNAGNVQAAAVAAPSIPPAQLQADSDAIKALGVLQNMTFMSFNYNTTTNISNGSYGRQDSLTMNALAIFASGTKTLTFQLTKTGSVYTITSFSYQ